VVASPVNVTSGDRTLVGPLLRSSADAGACGARRSASGVRTRDGRRRTVGVGWSTGGIRRHRGRRRGGIRIGGTTVSKADNLGASNDESIKGVGPYIRPLESIIHSGEGGEFAGGWAVSTSILHVDLNATRVVLGLSG